MRWGILLLLAGSLVAIEADQIVLAATAPLERTFFDGSSLEIQVPARASEAGREPGVVVALSASGHGHTLEIVGVEAVDGGVVLRRLGYRIGSDLAADGWGDRLFSVTFRTAEDSPAEARPRFAAFDRLERSRAEVRFPTGANTRRCRGTWRTTADLARCWWRWSGDREERAFRFCGYMGGRTVEAHAGPAALVGALRDWCDQLEWREGETTAAEAGELFAAVWSRTRGRFVDPEAAGYEGSWWWIRERLLAIATRCGDARQRDDCLAILARPIEEGESASWARSRRRAARALAAITGEDLRFDAADQPLPIAVVADRYRDLLAADRETGAETGSGP